MEGREEVKKGDTKDKAIHLQETELCSGSYVVVWKSPMSKVYGSSLNGFADISQHLKRRTFGYGPRRRRLEV